MVASICLSLQSAVRSCSDCRLDSTRVIVAVALCALTTTAAYYLISNGFTHYNMATTGWQRFDAGYMIYMGVASGVGSLAHIVYPILRGDDEYEIGDVAIQLFVTCFPYIIPCY